jgi:hypothetical protein
VSGREIDVSALGTEAGVTDAAATLAKAICDDILYHVIDLTPPAMRQSFFERFISAFVGVACAELGPDRAKQVLEAVKLAVDDVVAKRRHAD